MDVILLSSLIYYQNCILLSIQPYIKSDWIYTKRLTPKSPDYGTRKPLYPKKAAPPKQSAAPLNMYEGIITRYLCQSKVFIGVFFPSRII